MTIEQAKSELMQIYGALSPNKQRAIDTLVKIEPCEDCISRKAVLGIVRGMKGLARAYILPEAINQVKSLPPVNPQPKTGHCKDCKYFEYDSVAKVDGIPLIVAHEICKRWGDGCKTREDGYCFLYEPKMEGIKNE